MNEAADRGVTEIEPRLKALMLRGLDGDAAAYRLLLGDMGGYLRAYFVRRLGARSSEIEDLVQETLLAIHAKRATYDRTQPFTPWTYAMAHYKLVDHMRRSRWRGPMPDGAIEDLFDDRNPEEGTVKRDLDRLLSRLPSRQGELLRAVKVEGFSMEEAGAKLGMSAAAVRVTIHRGLKALTQKVRDEDR